jgi:hypothetical protein
MLNRGAQKTLEKNLFTDFNHVRETVQNTEIAFPTSEYEEKRPTMCH